MKHPGSSVSKASICGLVLATLALAGPVRAESKQGRAVVHEIRGSADYSTGGGAFTALTAGSSLEAGSVVRTGADSECDLFLPQNGPVIGIRADTVLGLDKLIYDGTGAETVIETRLDLKSGRVTGHVKKMAAASKYEVKVPNGMVSVRATEAKGLDYDIEATGRTTLKNGSASMVFNSVTYTINAGQTFDPTITRVRTMTAGQEPSAPFLAPPPVAESMSAEG